MGVVQWWGGGRRTDRCALRSVFPKGSDYVIYSQLLAQLQHADPFHMSPFLTCRVWYVVSECQSMVGVPGDVVSCFGTDGKGKLVSAAPEATLFTIYELQCCLVTVLSGHE